MNISRKLNVLQLINGFRVGGAQRKLLELVKLLDKDEYNISVYSVGSGGPLQSEFEKLGVKVRVFTNTFSFDISLILKVARLMRKERIDILQTTLFYADFIGALAAKLAGIPVVISWETASHSPGDVLRIKPRHRIGYRFAMKFVDKIVAVSDEIKTSLIERRGINPDKIITIPYGVDLSRFRPSEGLRKRLELGLSSNETVVGTVAHLEEYKGQKFFLKALFDVIDKFPKIKCVFVGEGQLRQYLETSVKAHGVASNFIFLGVRNDIPELMRVFDIFVLPSLSEGLPNVILEAMACSKPVIATNVGGIPEAVVEGETGLLIPPRDSNSIAHAVITLLENKDIGLRLGQAGRKRVERFFSIDREVDNFQNLYDSFFMKNQGVRQYASQ